MTVLIAFSVTPLGLNEHVAEVVADAIKVVRDSGLPNRTDAMFTTIEGDTLEETMDVVNRAIKVVADRAPRVSTVVKIDHFPGRANGMTDKVTAIENHLKPTELTACRLESDSSGLCR